MPSFQVRMQTHLTVHYLSQGTLIYKFIKEIAFAREEHVRTEEMLGKDSAHWRDTSLACDIEFCLGMKTGYVGKADLQSTALRDTYVADLGRTFKEREADTYEKLKIIDEEQLGNESGSTVLAAKNWAILNQTT